MWANIHSVQHAGAGGSYVYNPGNLAGAIQTVTPAATTTYTVTGTNASGCTCDNHNNRDC
jgi:hypothetical protein